MRRPLSELAGELPATGDEEAARQQALALLAAYLEELAPRRRPSRLRRQKHSGVFELAVAYVLGLRLWAEAPVERLRAVGYTLGEARAARDRGIDCVSADLAVAVQAKWYGPRSRVGQGHIDRLLAETVRTGSARRVLVCSEWTPPLPRSALEPNQRLEIAELSDAHLDEVCLLALLSRGVEPPWDLDGGESGSGSEASEGGSSWLTSGGEESEGRGEEESSWAGSSGAEELSETGGSGEEGSSETGGSGGEGSSWAEGGGSEASSASSSGSRRRAPRYAPAGGRRAR